MKNKPAAPEAFSFSQTRLMVGAHQIKDLPPGTYYLLGDYFTANLGPELDKALHFYEEMAKGTAAAEDLQLYHVSALERVTLVAGFYGTQKMG